MSRDGVCMRVDVCACVCMYEKVKMCTVKVPTFMLRVECLGSLLCEGDLILLHHLDVCLCNLNTGTWQTAHQRREVKTERECVCVCAKLRSRARRHTEKERHTHTDTLTHIHRDTKIERGIDREDANMPL